MHSSLNLFWGLDYTLIEWLDETVHADRHKLELDNLADDPGEQNNLAVKLPAKAEQMRRMLNLRRYDVGAQEMSPNPNYNPKKAKRSK